MSPYYVLMCPWWLSYRRWKLWLWWLAAHCPPLFALSISLRCSGHPVKNSVNKLSHCKKPPVAIIEVLTKSSWLKTYNNFWSCCCCTLLRLCLSSFFWTFIFFAISSFAAVACPTSPRCCCEPSIGGRTGNFDMPSGRSPCAVALKPAGEVAISGNKPLWRTTGKSN